MKQIYKKLGKIICTRIQRYCLVLRALLRKGKKRRKFSQFGKNQCLDNVKKIVMKISDEINGLGVFKI